MLRDAELDGRWRGDVRIEKGVVTELGPGLRAAEGAVVYDCGGGALLPGLCDHHVHLHALAAARCSVACGPPTVTGSVQLRATLANAEGDADGWVRGTGYEESVAGQLDAGCLDQLHPHRPVRIQHRSGVLWYLNTVAMTALGIRGAEHAGIELDPTGRPVGRVWRADGWLRDRLPPARFPSLAAVGGDLARFGITTITDATPELDNQAIAAIADAQRSGDLPQHVRLLGYPITPLTGAPPVAGPYKIVLADSGLPTLDELTAQISRSHEMGRAVALHCVSRTALALLLAAMDDTGVLPGDRIEHAALVPTELVGELAARGLRVVTQPGFIADRGDSFLAGVSPAEHADLYRLRTLLDAGVAVGLSSDAPYGPVDPWMVIAAAVDRRTVGGQLLGPAERVTAGQALDGYLSSADDPGGSPRRVRAGAPADLILLRVPLSEALARPHARHVRLVLINGEVVHG